MVVERFEAQQTAKGAPVYKAFGGRWNKFGVTVWPEVMDAQYDTTDIEVGMEWQANDSPVAVVLLNEKGNPQKVLRFVETQPA